MISAWLQEHYGKSSLEAVAAVKALYREMGLEQVFFDYEQASTQNLLNPILSYTYPRTHFIKHIAPLPQGSASEPYTLTCTPQPRGFVSKP